MVRTKYFRAEVKREGEWWSIRIPELSNLTTQARRLLDAEDEARGKIASRLGIGRDAFAVEMEEVRDGSSQPALPGWRLGTLAHPG